MKKTIIFLMLIFSIVLLTSCEKITKCQINKHKDFYIIQQYKKNKKYVDEICNVLDIKIEIEELGSDKSISINFAEGIIAEFSDNATMKSKMSLLQNRTGQFNWAHTGIDNYFYSEDVYSYAILYGKPPIEDKYLYYKDLENSNKLICAGYNYLDISKYLNDETIVIAENTKSILNFAFISFGKIKYIKCNESLEYIHSLAFVGLNELEIIYLNKGLRGISRNAFTRCGNIKYVVIPESVEEIGVSAFESGTIFCEHEVKPYKWSKGWATKNAKVYWKGEWEYNSEGIPVPISE